MPTAGLVLGIVSFVGVLVGLFPCLGWMNWFNLLLALLGIIFSGVGMGSANKTGVGKGAAVGGLVLSILALLGGGIRLILGGGVV